MRRLLKGILLFALIPVLIATSVVAWVVYQNGIAEVSFTVLRAEASWEAIAIDPDPIFSGAPFTARGKTKLTIENAETLYVSFAVVTLTDEEMAALESLSVAIGEDTNDDGEIDVMWGTIESLPIPIPWPAPFALSAGVYDVVILVEGRAGYPEAETPISFVVEGTCEATPINLP